MARYLLEVFVHVDEEDQDLAEQIVTDVLTQEHLYPEQLGLTRLEKEEVIK